MRLKLLGILSGIAIITAGFGLDAASARGRESSVVRAVTSNPLVVSFACGLLSPSHSHADHAAAASSPAAGHTHTAAHVAGAAAPAGVDEHAVHSAEAAAAAPATTHQHPAPGPSGPAPGVTASSDHEHPSDGECHPTAEQYNAAMKLVADTKAAISSRFADVQAAVAAGYRPNQSVRTEYAHYINDQERADPRILDPNHIEALIYGRTEHHGIKLIGAMYMMPKPGMEGPQIGGCLTVWHHHFGDDPGPTGDPEMLHVWIVDMPGGPFTNHPDENYIRNL